MSFLEIKSVSLSFGGVKALENVTLDIHQGGIISFIGPNGAGKSTLMNCISGFYKPQEGSICFQGKKINGVRPDKIANMGLLRTFQNMEQVGSLTVLDSFMLGLHRKSSSSFLSNCFYGKKTKKEEIEHYYKARELREFLDIDEKDEDKLVRGLPLGIQKRVEIGRAVISEPSILLLDEPLAGLDLKEIEEVLKIIDKLKKEILLTLLLVEHNMEAVVGISDRIVVLQMGSVIADGFPHEIQKDPKVIEAYLGVDYANVV